METSWQLIWILMAPGRQHKFHALLLPLAAPAAHVYTIEACVCGTINLIYVYTSAYRL